ncbi:hypothetical protein PVAG01_04975 [Phlyctema vagabunda]|uniref:Pentatricopeptide repeat domain-containing protein n=1 Tax=Phlyctema vagabunda TaxID=108571 RepID=A0ABR4PIR6_9HELO
MDRYLLLRASPPFPTCQLYSRRRTTTTKLVGLRIRRHLQTSSQPSHSGLDAKSTPSSYSIRWTCAPRPDIAPGFTSLRQQLTSIRHAVNDGDTPFTPVQVRQVWKEEIYTKLDESQPPPVVTTAYGDVVLSEFPRIEMTGDKDLQRLKLAIATANPHIILSALINAVRYDGQGHFDSEPLKSFSASMFSEILRCINPKHFLARQCALLLEFDRQRAATTGIPIYKSYAFIPVFLSQVQGVIAARSSSHPMSVTEYKYLLECARETGQKDVADRIWTSMEEQGVKPDVDCYNHFMYAKCWAELMNPEHRYTLRVNHGTLRLWRWRQSPYRFTGREIENSGIKIQIANIFRSMAKNGISGNEETFCLMMTGLSREGGINGVESALKTVWGIDVTALMSEEIEPKPKHLARTSPVYPSENLLFTLAHIYGTNSDIPTAMRLVDHVSRHYGIDIPTRVWEELLQRVYVLSAKYPSRVKEEHPEYEMLKGQLPLNAVTALWKTMTSEPYSITPTMRMYDWHIRRLIRMKDFTYASQLMEEALAHHRAIVVILARRIQHQHYDLMNGLKVHIHSSTRDVRFLKLRLQRNRLYIKHWVDFLIRRMTKYRRNDYQFATQDLPNIVKTWELFLPRKVYGFKIPGAHVNILRTHAAKINNFRTHLKSTVYSQRVLPGGVPSYHTRFGILYQRRQVALRRRQEYAGKQKFLRDRDIRHIAEDGEAMDLLLLAER